MLLEVTEALSVPGIGGLWGGARYYIVYMRLLIFENFLKRVSLYCCECIWLMFKTFKRLDRAKA